MRSLMVFALPVCALAAPPFAWKDHKDGRLELLENGQTVLVYNYGPQLKSGAPEDRRRCCYLYPVLTPGGVSVLDDFPKDHWHHRGLFWAWPVVETQDGKYDLWTMKGIGHRPGRVHDTSASPADARLGAENEWVAGGKTIVREQVRVRVYWAVKGARELDVDLRFTAAEAPVTLRGSQERGKSYGGLSARFAPREQTLIRADSKILTKDEDLIPHEWAEMEAVYGGMRAVLRITPDPRNPGAPYQWCLRDYGFVGASFPGRTESVGGYTIEPGKPLVLRFRVTLADSN